LRKEWSCSSASGIDVPRSAQDFLKPGFNGKVITCYPNDDDVTLYLFYTIVQKYGWEFMDKYMATNPQWVRGHLGTARDVASGQAAVTFDTMTNVTLGLKKTTSQPTSLFRTLILCRSGPKQRRSSRRVGPPAVWTQQPDIRVSVLSRADPFLRVSDAAVYVTDVLLPNQSTTARKDLARTASDTI
jgi:hypothetical protein